jgi:hypothetical protein
MHGVGLLRVGPAIRIDPVADTVTLAAPAIGELRVDLMRLGEAHSAVERRPAADLRHRIVLNRLQLPDAGILQHP